MGALQVGLEWRLPGAQLCSLLTAVLREVYGRLGYLRHRRASILTGQRPRLRLLLLKALADLKSCHVVFLHHLLVLVAYVELGAIDRRFSEGGNIACR